MKRSVFYLFVFFLFANLYGQSLSIKTCKTCGRPLAQCQYKGKHPSFTPQSSVADIEKVFVVFRGQPDVVYISVDGETKGTNYADISIVPGKHSVTYSKEGYESRTEDVIIPQGQTYTINYRLEAKATEATMDYTMSTNPDGCFVYIDDNWVGTTPIVVKEKNGTHKLKVEKIGYQTKEYSGYIFSSNPNIQVNLDPISASMQSSLSQYQEESYENFSIPIDGKTFNNGYQNIIAYHVEESSDRTIVQKKCIPIKPSTAISCNRQEFIEDCATGNRYYLNGSSIGIGQHAFIENNAWFYFSEYYPKLPKSVKMINISSGSFYYAKNVRIR